ncbi:MAG: FecR family protein [Endomicrobia bacterium]|nr:FecR family protein [Endomicrobiia bacterium]
MKKIFFLFFLLAFLYKICFTKDGDKPIAVIAKFKGRAVLIRNTKEIKLEKYMPVYINDKLKTSSFSYIELIFENGVTLRIEENALVDMRKFIYVSTSKNDMTMILKLFQGAVIVDANFSKERYSLNSLYVVTPTAVASVRGTVFYVSIYDDRSTTVAVFDGEVIGYSESLEEEEILKLDYELDRDLEEDLIRKKFIINKNKQVKFSEDMPASSLMDISISLMEYKRTVVDTFIKVSNEYRKNLDRFKKQRDEWIKIHKDNFKYEFMENKKRFLDEFDK